MQWLIDLIKAWVQAQGYLTTSFVDRGAAADYDFKTADFTKDANWHNLDLSAIVPAGAKAVLVRALTKDETIGRVFQLRSNETPSVYNVSVSITQVAFLRVSHDMIVHLGSTRIIEYKATSDAWLDILVTVRGWWL